MTETTRKARGMDMDEARQRRIREIGERVRALRGAMYLTQAELAGKAGVSRDVVARLEIGRNLPYPSNLKKLAVALGVSPQELESPVGVTVEGSGAEYERGVRDGFTLRGVLDGEDSISDEHLRVLRSMRGDAAAREAILSDDSFLDEEREFSGTVALSTGATS